MPESEASKQRGKFRRLKPRAEFTPGIPLTTEQLIRYSEDLPTIRNRGDARRCPRQKRSIIVEGLLSIEDVCNIIGATKMGKTLFINSLCDAVATGRMWLGKYATTLGKVLIVDNELHEDTFDFRVNSLAERMKSPEGSDERFNYVTVRGRQFGLPQLEALLESVKNRGFTLVILDALYEFLPEDVDENSGLLMGPVYRHLMYLASKYNVTGQTLALG